MALHINTDKYLPKFKVISVEKKEVKCIIYGVDNEESEDIAVFDFEHVSRYGSNYNAEQPKSEAVNHPNHYNVGGIEVIDFIESWNLGFSLGNAIKYIARAPYKNDELEDLKKARWYIDREIQRLEKDTK